MSRYRVVTWVAFADFFVALSVVSFGLYANKRNEIERAHGQLKACEEQMVAISVEDEEGNTVPVTTLLLELAKEVSDDLHKAGIRVEVDERRASVVLSEGFIQFAPGQYRITEGSPEEAKLKVVAECLARQRRRWLQNFVLAIQGHTDIFPVSPRPEFSSNVELARLRAQEVEAVLFRYGVRPPDFQVVAQGAGEFQPKDFPDCKTPSGNRVICADGRYVTSRDLARNRRIELRFGLFTGN